MDEKIIIKADFYKFKFFIAFLWTLCPILFFVFMANAIDEGEMGIMFAGIVVVALLALYILLLSYVLKKRELIVTNKRVISRRAFAFRRDIPIEMVTDVSSRLFWGISCGSPSTKIFFSFCKNYKEVFDAISHEVLKRDRRYM